ncbi:SixA phosphatase family protein [Flexithrix dorotheae]|uniref:SixA phosphatase family protein n=1 Tax=Flexithrix dorotheae TaxID=70993 RepID=UPI00036C60C2|nr:histidine phosphatase family protein [Flexithrix dorotheae]
MSKALIIIRHAEAIPPGNEIKDFDRPLSSGGLTHAMKLGRALYQKNIAPDKFICSKAVRTESTAKLIAEQIHFEASEIDLNEDIYNISLGNFLTFVKKLDDSLNTVFVVGHNPTLSYFVEFVSNKTGYDLEPGAAVKINFDIISWLLIDQNNGEIEWRL